MGSGGEVSRSVKPVRAARRGDGSSVQVPGGAVGTSGKLRQRGQAERDVPGLADDVLLAQEGSAEAFERIYRTIAASR